MITVLTCTGGRQMCFDRLEFYMKRQTVQPDQWIVVDDCQEPTVCSMGQEVIRRQPWWKPGDMTLPQNMIAGLEKVRGDIVLVMEDDDWYRADYIEKMAELLQAYELVGEGRAKYYNIYNYRQILHPNMAHASLCQTGFRSAVIPDIMRVLTCNRTYQYVDLHMWKLDINKYIFPLDESLCVGIKGMPGRPGAGYGHGDKMGVIDKQPFEKLSQWIGDDVGFYRDVSQKIHSGELCKQ